MNWDALGAIAEMVGAMGVLATLIYLAFQIRDNTRSLHAASLESILEGARERYFLPMASTSDMANIYARGLNSLDQLDEDETRRFFYMMYEQLFQMQQVWQLRERNLIPQVDYDAWLDYTASLLRTEGGAEMWPHCEKVITPTIASIINSRLTLHQDDPSFIDMIPIFKTELKGYSDAT